MYKLKKIVKSKAYVIAMWLRLSLFAEIDVKSVGA